MQPLAPYTNLYDTRPTAKYVLANLVEFWASRIANNIRSHGFHFKFFRKSVTSRRFLVWCFSYGSFPFVDMGAELWQNVRSGHGPWFMDQLNSGVVFGLFCQRGCFWMEKQICPPWSGIDCYNLFDFVTPQKFTFNFEASKFLWLTGSLFHQFCT